MEIIWVVLLILISIAIFILLLAVNSWQIFGFYQATNYEYEADKLDFDAVIKKGKLTILGDVGEEDLVEYAVIEKAEDMPVSTQHFTVRIPHGVKEIKFVSDPASDTDITIENYQRIEKIDDDSKEIFWEIRYHAKRILGDYLCKPIACCPICMSSVHSLWVWIPAYFYFEFSAWLLYAHVLYMMCLCGINKLVMLKFDFD